MYTDSAAQAGTVSIARLNRAAASYRDIRQAWEPVLRMALDVVALVTMPHRFWSRPRPSVAKP